MHKSESFIVLNDEAFGRLVNRYKERIYSVVLRMVKNSEEAKDLAQEAFVKAYDNRRSFRAESGFYTWVYRIAVNLALNYLERNRDRHAESIEDTPALVADTPASDDLDRAELRFVITTAVDALSPRRRAVFVLRHYEDKPYAEIASILAITEGAAKAHYFQAIQKLKASLRAYLDEGRIVV